MQGGETKLLVPNAVRDVLKKMHPDLRRQIKAALQLILDEPEIGTPLRDELSGLRSLRVRRLRIVYRPQARAIAIVSVGPRVVVYEETLKLLKS